MELKLFVFVKFVVFNVPTFPDTELTLEFVLEEEEGEEVAAQNEKAVGTSLWPPIVKTGIKGRFTFHICILTSTSCEQLAM